MLNMLRYLSKFESVLRVLTRSSRYRNTFRTCVEIYPGQQWAQGLDPVWYNCGAQKKDDLCAAHRHFQLDPGLRRDAPG